MIVIVPNEEDWKKRLELRKEAEGEDVPESVMLEMKGWESVGICRLEGLGKAAGRGGEVCGALAAVFRRGGAEKRDEILHRGFCSLSFPP